MGQDTPSLPAVTVTAAMDMETATGPLSGYVAQRAMSGSKTDTAIIDTPQSVSVVTNDELRSRQAETLSQALNYTPGRHHHAHQLQPHGRPFSHPWP